MTPRPDLEAVKAMLDEALLRADEGHWQINVAKLAATVLEWFAAHYEPTATKLRTRLHTMVAEDGQSLTYLAVDESNVVKILGRHDINDVEGDQ